MRAVILPIAAVSLLVACLAAWAGWRLGSAEARLSAAAESAADLRRQAERIRSLRTRSSVTHGRRPDADLIASVQKALIGLGLPPSTFVGIQPRAEQSAAGGVRVQTVQLTLARVAPGDLGGWLAAWRTPDQPWSVTELQLVHAAQAPDDPVYDVALVLSAPFIEE